MPSDFASATFTSPYPPMVTPESLRFLLAQDGKRVSLQWAHLFVKWESALGLS